MPWFFASAISHPMFHWLRSARRRERFHDWTNPSAVPHARPEPAGFHARDVIRLGDGERRMMGAEKIASSAVFWLATDCAEGIGATFTSWLGPQTAIQVP